MNTSKNEILFNKFEILSCYKKDEYSAVYLANHIYLEKKVFLKILNTVTIPDNSITERFKREAKILAKLEHPNIIRVFDFGMYKDHFYISFEYFESKNLREIWASKKLTEDEQKEIFIQLLQGLDFAHSKKIIHRDIKPENILINKNNKVKLTDFGLSQLSSESFITKKYSVVGTPAYMSPEQIQGENLTYKSDLFSLGIVAVELFCGINPLLGKDINETINKIISFDEKKHKELLQNRNSDIQKILNGLLNPIPDYRFESCNEVLSLLNIKPITINEKDKKSFKKYWFFVSIFILSVTMIIVVNYFEKLTEAKKDIKIIEKDKPEILVEKKDLNKITNSAEIKSNYQNSVNNENQKNLKDLKKEINSAINIIHEDSEIGFGQLYVKCYPWAKVYIDEKFIETTPFTKNISINSGKHLITLIHPDYPNYYDTVIVSKSEISNVEVNLDTMFALLDCKVFPWSEIYIDGIIKGTTPLLSPIKLLEGNYKLTLKNPQFKNFDTLITTVKNDTLKLEFNINEYN